MSGSLQCHSIAMDLFKRIDNTTKAIESSEKAMPLKIAKESQLGDERHFTESRLQVLQT